MYRILPLRNSNAPSPIGRVATLVVVVLLVAGSPGRAGSEFHNVLGHVHFALADAVRAAQDSFEGYAVDATLESEDDMYYYRVALVDPEGRTNVFVNPANGLIIGVQREEGIAVRLRSRWERELTACKSAKISLLDAVTTASEISGGHVVEADFRTYRDPPTYFIRIVTGDKEHEVSLAAENGAILEHDIDG